MGVKVRSGFRGIVYEGIRKGGGQEISLLIFNKYEFIILHKFMHFMILN